MPRAFSWRTRSEYADRDRVDAGEGFVEQHE